MYWPKIDQKKAYEIQKFVTENTNKRFKKIERNSMDASVSQSVPKQRGQSLNYERPWRKSVINNYESGEQTQTNDSTERKVTRTVPKSSIMIKRKLDRGESPGNLHQNHSQNILNQKTKGNSPKKIKVDYLAEIRKNRLAEEKNGSKVKRINNSMDVQTNDDL